jgi:hypothetical protein
MFIYRAKGFVASGVSLEDCLLPELTWKTVLLPALAWQTCFASGVSFEDLFCFIRR